MTLSQYAAQFFKLADMLREIKDEAKVCADALRSAGPQRYKGVTVYRVRRHRVKAHWRESHTRVRT